ncbi:MAG: alpha/beta hydrolase [Pseudomonadales bacterium]|jgi:acetyl esterase/lipase|nr:alpha/beta hydrolase [Pseudomonadales bacterium]
MPSSEHETLVAMLRAGPASADALADIPAMRTSMETMMAALPLAPGTTCEDDDADGVPVSWVTAPGTDAGRVVLYLHGGGYVIGSRATHRSLASRISAASGARVLLVEYRLAPEHPFPAAVDDALAAWNWLLARAVDPSRAAVAGDSAGGGLALALLQRIRASGVPMPACAVCLSPWADLEGTGESAAPGAVDDPMVTVEGLRVMAGHYVGDAAAQPLASPIHADYEGFPPLLVQVGTREVLLSDARTVAAKARAAGAEVTLEEEAGLIHVWQAFPGVPESDAAVARIGRYLDRQLG